MTAYDYDLFVIGAGSGGVRAARIAGGHGARVAIAEESRFGGTCVIRGCVPKKLLVYAGRFRDELEDAAGFGWTLTGRSFDWARLIANKDKEIDRLEAAYKATLGRAKVEAFPTRAEIVDAHTVSLKEPARRVTARVILVATGGAPRRLDIPGGEHAITSNEAFHLERLPASMMIVGGGYIAVEFASIFNALGVKTTLAYRRDRILRGFDDDLRDDLAAALQRRGIEIVTGAVPARIEPTDGTFRVTMSDGRALETGLVMTAVGRDPATRGLGLERAGVALGAKGEIKVDGESRTSVPSIYAVGDVTDRVNLTPVAIREGHAFADSVFGKKPWTVAYGTIPTAVFATPEVGTVGMSEGEARLKGHTLDIYKTRFRPMKYTMSGRDERTLMKLVVDAASQVVLGVHILGPDAAEMVQMAAIAMRLRATKADFDQTMALHPSAAEELVTLREKWVAPATA